MGGTRGVPQDTVAGEGQGKAGKAGKGRGQLAGRRAHNRAKDTVSTNIEEKLIRVQGTLPGTVDECAPSQG